jgi:predicted phage replisome organizer
MQVKWIKLCTDIFDDEKILLIESLPDCYAIITVWFKLLCLAGKQNNCGVFMFNDKMPYTEKMLSTVFRMNESTVSMAIQTFEQFGMVEIIDGVITIPNWEKHQNEEKMAEIREYNRLAQQRSREKRKLLNAVNDNVNDKTLTSQDCQDTEEDKIKEIDNRIKNKDIKKKKSSFDSILSEISDDELRNLYYEFINMRKQIKSPITSDRALNMLINKVNELEPKDIGRQKKMLENAIVNNWKSVYPLKEEPKKEIKTDASYDIEAFRRQGLCGELKYERKKK